MQETWLRASDDLSIPNYVVHRSDRAGCRGGGTAVAIKKSIVHSRLPPPQSLTTLELTAVRVKFSGASCMNICSAYQSPSRAFDERVYDDVFSGGVPVFVAGDLNSKHGAWNCRIENRFGKRLHGIVAVLGLTVHAPTEPTYFRAGVTPDILDIALSKDLACLVECEVVPELSSDHNPVLYYFYRTDAVMHNPRMISRTDWELFGSMCGERSVMHPLGEGLLTEQQLERGAAWVSKMIQETMGACTKSRPFTPGRSLPSHIRNLLANRRRLKKAYQVTLAPIDKHLLNVASRQLRGALREYRESEWRGTVEGLIPEDSSLWRFCKSLGKDCRGSDRPRPLHGSAGVVYSDAEKAEAFADVVEAACREGDGHGAVSDEDSSSDGGSVAGEPMAGALDPTTRDEVASLIRVRKDGKAPGPDQITNRALKYLPPPTLDLLVNIYNAAMTLKIFPSIWKTADVVMVPKPNKDKLFPQNYRPISLLSGLGKVLEAVIRTRLREEADRLKVIPPDQFGFREGLSTELQLFRLVTTIRGGLDRGEATMALLLDLTRAFDRLWHDGLILKMSRMGFCTEMMDLVLSYLTERRFSIRCGSERSSVRRVGAGVPQGSLLGPDLFLIFMADLPTAAGVELAIYADDVAIYSTCKNENYLIRKVQREVDAIERWCDLWGMELNPEKCQAIRFSNKIGAPRDTLSVSGQRIPWMGSVRYLGVVMDPRLTWRQHVLETKRKVGCAINNLAPLINVPALGLSNRLILFNTIVGPIMTYAAVVFHAAAETHILKLEMLQSAFLRRIVRAPWYVRNQRIREDLGMPSVRETLVLTAKNTLRIAENSDNAHLRQVVAALRGTLR